MPEEHGLVIHLSTEDAIAMVILVIFWCCRIKIQYQNPPRAFQYAICFPRNLKQVNIVAEVEAKAKNHDIKSGILERQIFRCSNYSQTIYVQGRPQEARGRACRQPDGTWAIVS